MFNRIKLCTKNVRYIRTSRRVPTPIIDIESQLKQYPPQVRKDILAQLHAKDQPQAPTEDNPRASHGVKTENSPSRLFGRKVDEMEFLNGLIRQSLALVDSPAALDKTFWRSVQSLTSLALKNKTPEFFDLYVELFEAAKKVENQQERIKLIYITGKYIYRLRKVRMDPVNEVEYLDALVAHNRPFVALKLWRSRLGREDVREVHEYWMEVGALYHLEAGLLTKANALAVENNLRSLRLAVNLIDVWARQLSLNRQPETASKWLEHWTHVACAGADTRPSPTVPEPISLLKQAIQALIVARQWSLADEMVKLIPDQDLSKSDIITAFSLSVNSKCAESDILPLFSDLSYKCPELATDPVVGASLALALARTQDFYSSISVLEELKLRGKSVPVIFQSAIFQTFEKYDSDLLRTARELLVEGAS